MTVFHVVSDVQGAISAFGDALDQIAEIAPESKALVINGDITPRGYRFEYEQVAKALAEHPHPGETYFVIGNHEFYVPKWSDPDTLAQASWPNGTTEAELFQNFYEFSGLDQVWYERVVDGVPLLMLGTEKYMKFHDDSLWDEVWMSPEQLAWLRERVAHWTALGKPVFVFSHHVLPDSVSATRQELYSRDYLQIDELLDILGPHRNVFFFTGHTHWDLRLSDWAVRKVVPGSGNAEGFIVVNTGSVQSLWTDDGHGGERHLGDDSANGLQVRVDDGEVLIRARDFKNREWIKEVRIPVPAVGH
jgi:hypothetical protein